jgi:hypothetical protein
MTEVPKIVHDRLQAASPKQAASGPAHPDADLLTAFAEQALSAAERDDVLEHLALCGDCREVIALALPDEVPAVPATVSRAGAPAPHRPSFAWPSLRWAALVAGVAVAASVLLMHPGKLNQATPPSVSSPVASSAQPTSSPQAPAPAANQVTEFARTDEARSEAKSPLSKKVVVGEEAVTVATAEQVARAKQGVLLADNKPDVGHNDRREDKPDATKDAAIADKAAAGRSTGAAAGGGAGGQPIPGSVSEMVEVTAESPVVQAEVPAEAQPMARNSAPAVEKAKPALDTESSQLQSTISTATTSELPLNGRNVTNVVTLAGAAKPNGASNVTWTVKAGVLRRSVDHGHSWQNALRADHPLRCYASRDHDVWAGGQAGTLFHSADSGLTWVQVRPSVNGQGLSSDIAQIDLRSDVRGDMRNEARRDAHSDAQALGEIVLTTRNNETWSSADTGKTWEKK